MRAWPSFFFIPVLVIPFALFFSSEARAEEAITGPKPCAFVQKTPQAPENIRKPKSFKPLGCERPFSYRGQIYSVDTPQAQDAVVLKYFVQSVPEANQLLEQYQTNRIRSRLSAYTGTAGVLLLGLANLILIHTDIKSGQKNYRDDIRAVLNVAGFTLAGGGFIYSFALLRTNEILLPKAVETYNVAKPNDPIELQFSTSWGF